MRRSTWLSSVLLKKGRGSGQQFRTVRFVVSNIQQLTHRATKLSLQRSGVLQTEGGTKHKQRHLTLLRQNPAVAAVVIHAVIGGDDHLIARREPVTKVMRQDTVGYPGFVTILRCGKTKLMAGIINIH